MQAVSADPALAKWTRKRLQPAVGLHLLQVDPHRWQQMLEANPLIERAVIRRWLLPCRIEAVVSSRRPWILGTWPLAGGGERTGVIDRDGQVLPLPEGTKTETGMTFRVPTPIGNRVKPAVIDGVALLVAYLQHEALPEKGAFDLSDPKNAVWTAAGVSVWLGDVAGFPDSLKVKLGGILPMLLPLAREKGQNLEYLDLRDWQNPVFKLK